MHRDYDGCDDLWADVQHTREAIHARAALIRYTILVSAPFVLLVAAGALLLGLRPHEITGLSCYNAMITTIFFFDTLRNAAHECFEDACERGMVNVRDGIPVIEETYPHRRLASLSFAIGGRVL